MNKDSWSTGANLYQAKLFPVDYYSRVGSEAQHHVRPKTSWISHSTGVDFNNGPTEYMRPFKGNNHLNLLKEALKPLPRIKWNCPPKFFIDYKWHVASGEESEERVTQKHRETRAVEAVCPHLSAIPPSPSVSLDAENFHQDESTIPVIPVTAIEEAAEPSPNTEAARNISVHSQAPDLPPGTPTSRNINTPRSLNPPSSPKKPDLGVLLPSSGGDVAVAAASAALTALVKSQEKGSLIDTDLLIKFLSDPKLIEKLTNEHGATDKTGGDRLLVPKPVKEFLPLALRPEMVTKKSMNDHGAPGASTTTGTTPISGPKKTFTPLVTMTSENRSLGHMSPTPVSWAPSVPLPNSKPVDMTTKNWINEYCSAQTAGLKLVTPSVPFPGTYSDVVTIKRMINEYGAPAYGVPANMGNKPVPWPANLLQSSIRSPSPGNTHTSPFLAPTAPPFRDMNYIKGLIKEHGERQQKQDSDPSLFGRLYNDLPGPEPVKNLKTSELKPKNEKPCIYFNSSRGCRKGSSCLYKHAMFNGPSRDMGARPGRPGRVPGANDAKRLRL